MTNIGHTKKYRFYIGLNDKDVGKQLLSTNQVVSIIDKVFDNYTVYTANGRYKYFDGTVENETTIVVTYFDFINELNETKIKNITKFLKTHLNQELILVEIQETNSQLI